MTITTLPTQTSGSLGSEKSNVKSLTDETHQLSAEQWNETVETVIALANEVGLSDGSTNDSLNKRVAALETSSATNIIKKALMKQALAGITGTSSSGSSSNIRKYGRMLFLSSGFYTVGYNEYAYSISPSTGAGYIGYCQGSLSSFSISGNLSTSISAAKFNSLCRIDSSTTTVCVGYGGLIRRSTGSLSTWSTITPPSSYTGEYNDVIYVQDLDLIIAIGSGGAIHTSADQGATFTAQTNPDTSLDPVSIAYGNGVICIRTKGPSGFALTSPDGTTWTKQTVAGTDPSYCSQMIHDGQRFVCFAATVSTSVDGETWSTSGTIPGTMDARCVAGKNGIYVGGGYDSGPAIIYSLDQGDTWEVFDMQNASQHMIGAHLSDFCISSIAVDPFGTFAMMGSSYVDTDYSTYLFLRTLPTGNIFD